MRNKKELRKYCRAICQNYFLKKLAYFKKEKKSDKTVGKLKDDSGLRDFLRIKRVEINYKLKKLRRKVGK